MISKHQEGFNVDIGAAHTASLSMLSFEGATKRFKPNLQVLKKKTNLGWSISVWKNS